ncbi:MAG: right-handed parallel beta-helix repeat-containing protein [Saprospiraceae bacterium]|jgi:hypothetical protein|nr:right-handed parallel beta-helix repeat-containing protein [Saprospiraceae bacterium]
MFLLRRLPVIPTCLTCLFIFFIPSWCAAASAPNIAISGAHLASNTGPLCAGDSAAIQLYVNNLGSTPITLDSLKIAVTINSVFYKTITWRGPLVVAPFPAQIIGLEKVPVPATVNDVVLKLIEANGEPVPAETFTRTDIQIWQGLSGEYALGPNSTQFPNFKSAFNALEKWGVCGAVTFLAEPGDYESGTLLDLNGFPGAGISNPITFAAEIPGTVRILGLVSLSDAPGFTLRNLSVESNGAPAVSLQNCNNFLLDHCTIRVTNSSGVSITQNADGFKMANCRVETSGAAINANVNPGEPTRSGWEIRGCTFERLNGGNTQLSLGNLQDGVIANNVITGYLTVGGPSLRFTGNRMVDYSGDQTQNVGASIESRKAFIANNVLADPGSQLPLFEIWVDSTSEIELYHNTVFREYPTTAVTIRKTGPFPLGTVTAYNNNFVNLGTGMAFHADCKTLVSQNNNYYAAHGNPAAWHNGNTYPGNTWQNVWKQDTASVYLDPDFVFNSDYLRFENTSLADGGLTLLSIVPDDVFGEQRDAAPDLGAAESFGAVGDLTIADVQDGAGNCHGIPEVRVKITNVQSVRPATYSAQINWSVQGVAQTPYEWTGALAPGDTSDWITIGRHFFDYAGEELRVSVAHRYDVQSTNDTRVLPQQRRPMGGVYTIGANKADFQTLADAAAALRAMGMCDAVELQFQSGRHDAVCTVDSIPGNSVLQPLTITSLAGHRDSAVLDDVLKFNSGGGLHLLPAYINVQEISLRLGLALNHFTTARLYRCNMIDLVSGVSSGDSLTIEGCFIKPIASYAIHTDQDTRLVFRNNIVENGMPPNSSFDPNLQVYMIGFEQAVVEHNTFRYRTGIYARLGRGSRILNNWFQDIGVSAIDGQFEGTADEPVWIANNIFCSYSDDMVDAMLTMQVSNWVRVYHNTFFSGTPPVITSHSVGIRAIHVEPLDIQNNLFSNLRVAYDFWPDEEWVTTDYNRFDNSGIHLTGSGLIVPMSLSAWQNATGLDLNSAYADPLYQYEVDGTGYDLHLAAVDSLLPRVPNYLPEIPFDVDYEYRDLLTPCAGADEAGSLPPDAFVWPGDANADKTVNHLDWLYVGLGAGQQLAGPDRADQSITWAPKLAQNWPATIAGINAKHSDSDGSGDITAADTLAIVQNFARIHFFAGIEDRADVRLVFKNIPPVIKPGEAVSVDVHLEDAAGLPVNLYGIALTIGFQPAPVSPDSLTFEPVAGWLGIPGVDLWTSSWALEHPTALQVAMTRTDGANAAGSGRIGTLRFVPTAGSSADSFQIFARNDLALTNDGQQVPVSNGTGVFSYTSNLSSSLFAERPLEILPNPTSETIQITLPPMSGSQLIIFDLSGKVVFQNTDLSGSRTTVEIGHFPAGLYQVLLSGGAEVWVGQFVKQ